jgi:hypothetical protein
MMQFGCPDDYVCKPEATSIVSINVLGQYSEPELKTKRNNGSFTATDARSDADCAQLKAIGQGEERHQDGPTILSALFMQYLGLKSER